MIRKILVLMGIINDYDESASAYEAFTDAAAAEKYYQKHPETDWKKKPVRGDMRYWLEEITLHDSEDE